MYITHTHVQLGKHDDVYLVELRSLNSLELL